MANQIISPMKPYRFVWDEEPSEEQLAQIMREVACGVREQSLRIKKKLKDQIRQEINEAREELQKEKEPIK